MISARKTIHFSATLQMVTVQHGTASVYRMDEHAAVLLTRAPVTGPNFQLELEVSNTALYYVFLDVERYTRDGVLHTTDGRKVALVSVFRGADTFVTVSAQATIASMFTFARMSRYAEGSLLISGAPHRLAVALGMKNNFVHTDGGISEVIRSPPNGLETNSYPMLNFLSTLLYYSLTDASVYTHLMALASPGAPSSSFTEALTHLIRRPFTNVAAIYALIAPLRQVYTPSLAGLSLPPHKSPVPDQWTLTLKANDSGAKNFLFSGTAFVVFDKEGKAWITNNFRQGTPNSGTHCVVLHPDASPCAFSPLTGGGILGPGFGIAVDDAGERIAIGNFGWGPVEYNPQAGSISRFRYDGTVQSPPGGDTPLVSRAQGMCYDRRGNLWIASMGSQKPLAPAPDATYDFASANSAVVVWRDGDPSKAVAFTDFLGQPSPDHGTFDVTTDEEGFAYVANIGSKDAKLPSSVHKMRLDEHGLTCVATWTSHYKHASGEVGYEELRQVQVHGDSVFVVGITSSRVVQLEKDLSRVVATFEKNVFAPWGIVFDREGTMYLANFAQEKGRAANGTLDMQGPYGVTVIRDLDAETAQIMTLPTGGEGVTLANGQPLYGTIEGPDGERLQSWEPLMRLTSTNIDAAGNLWAMNNWKPSAKVDVALNPGGDGVVIFIGVAEPA